MSNTSQRELGKTNRPIEDALEDTFERTIDEGSQRLHRRWREILVTGFFGGTEVAMGVLAYLAVLNATGNQLLAGLAFSIGFLALLLGHSELFTEGFLVPVTTVAAKRASRPAIAAIEAALQGMRVAEEELRSGRDPAGSELRFQGYDMGFHEAVALASGNRILVYLFEAMADPLQESFFISRRGNELRGHTLADTIAAHQRILDAITQGSPRKAGEAMRVHLENTEGDIRAALSLLSATPSARTTT